MNNLGPTVSPETQLNFVTRAQVFGHINGSSRTQQITYLSENILPSTFTGARRQYIRVMKRYTNLRFPSWLPWNLVSVNARKNNSFDFAKGC